MARDSEIISNQSEFNLSHLNEKGEAEMVDVSSKNVTRRQAIAQGKITMKLATFEAIETGNTPKGDVLGTAKLAGIMAAKQTANLIPLCHPLPLHKIEVNIRGDENIIEATVITKAETGVEMEPLTAVSVAALTLYDMAKALEKSMKIENICLISKTGGKSGDYQKITDN